MKKITALLLALLMAVALCMGLLAGVAMAEDENLASAKGHPGTFLAQSLLGR